jgi:molybdenum cofactor synthesis domain-containing protein
VRVAILTISDAASRGEREDASGPAAAGWADSHGYEVTAGALVPDDALAIVRQLVSWCDGDVADLVLTTGGTGLSPRDVTPEATRAVIEREAAGVAERLRMETGADVARAALSRGIAGVRARTLVVNLPGSPRAVRECLDVLSPIAAHAIAVLRGDATDHSSAPGDSK